MRVGTYLRSENRHLVPGGPGEGEEAGRQRTVADGMGAWPARHGRHNRLRDLPLETHGETESGRDGEEPERTFASPHHKQDEQSHKTGRVDRKRGRDDRGPVGGCSFMTPA